MRDLSPETEELLLAFLDDGLPEPERDQVHRMIESDPRVVEYLEQQERIAGAIQRVYRPPAIDPDFLERLASPHPLDEAPAITVAPPTRRRRLLLAVFATAASLALAWLSVQSFIARPEGTIAYRQRPLVEVYQDCVRDGFEPYWVCDEPELFAVTFDRRQGVRLRLAELPAGQEMLGLSYLAGLSHNSTSMLATIGGQRVIVVVDRVESDWRPATGLFEESGLRVSRWERYGLAFYQVGPPETPRLDNAFELADTPSPMGEPQQ